MNKEDANKARVLDKIKQYEKTGEVLATTFLDPKEIFELSSVYEKYPHYLDGGYDDAERKILIIGKQEKDDEDDFLITLEISSRLPLAHRAVLGSTLATGIKRDVVGDIIIKDNVANMFVTKEIAKYIIQNLDQIGREKVKVKQIKTNDIIDYSSSIEELTTTISSLRIDSAISACYGVSRELSSELIKNEKVNLNYTQVSSSSKAVKEGDLISVRGYGRFEILEVVGETKKGRIRIKIKKYV